MIIHDQLNRPLQIDKPPQRIISLVPSQTELLVDLGLIKQLVGVTKFCVHPAGINKEKKTVGGTKQINLDKIKALNPDIILCNKEENTEEIVSQLSKHFTVHVSDVNNLEQTYELIQQYGKIFQLEEKAIEINQNIQKSLAKFKSFIKDKPQLRVAYFIWKDPWMVAAGDTFINYLLNLNHFLNVYESESRYPEVNLNQLKTTDIILLSSEPYPFSEKHKADIAPYVGNAKIKLIDGEFYSWYGSRLEKAFHYFKNWYKKEIEQA